MMKSKKHIVVVLSVFCAVFLVYNVAFASIYGSTFQNYDDTNWDKPNNGSYIASHYLGNNYLSTGITFSLSGGQISAMKLLNRYPTYDLKDDSKSGALSGYGASTTLPSPKFDYEDDNGDGKNEEVEVVVQNKNLLAALTSYNFNTYFQIYNTTANPYLIAYSGQSIPPICGGCDYNNVPGFEDALGGVYMQTIYESGSALANQLDFASHQFTIKDNITSQNLQTAETNVNSNVRQFENIKSRADLNNYKLKLIEQIDKVEESKVYRTITTLISPISIEDYSSMKLPIQNGITYARANDQFGNKVTLAKFNGDEASVFNQIVNDEKLTFQGIIQIDGELKGTDIKELINNKHVFTVEVGMEDYTPMGLYWTLEDLMN